MPEITSVEAVQMKLHQFDEQMDGAIAAAKMLCRIRSDAEKLLGDAKNTHARSAEVLQRAEATRTALQQLQQEWAALKAAFDKSQADSHETRDLLLSELDSALQSLDQKVMEAEERLRTTTQASLQEQADLLQQLDNNTRANAKVASDAKTTTTQLVQYAENLVRTTRDDLRNDIHTSTHQAQDSLKSQFQDWQEGLEGRLQADIGALNDDFQTTKSLLLKQDATQEQLLHDRIEAFQEEMRHGLKEHQQAIDRELTEFLNKQNALVQNLSQQIDGFHRLAQTLSGNLAETKVQVVALGTSLETQKKDHDDQAASMAGRIAEISTQLDATISALKRRSFFTGLK